jgi:hypothetical protein
MKATNPRGYLIAAVIAVIACTVQIVGLLRYIDRLPEDWVGIGLYIITIVAFALVAFGFYVQSQKR